MPETSEETAERGRSATPGVMHTAWLEDKWLWGLIGFAGLNLFWATVVGSAPILNAAVGGAMIWAASERYQDLYA